MPDFPLDSERRSLGLTWGRAGRARGPRGLRGGAGQTRRCGADFPQKRGAGAPLEEPASPSRARTRGGH